MVTAVRAHPDRLVGMEVCGTIGRTTSITAAYLRRIRRLEIPEKDRQKILGLNAVRFLSGDG